MLLPHPFLFLPLLQRQAKNIRVHLLGCNKQITSQRLFHDLENTSAGDKSFCDVMYDIDIVKTLRSFLFSLPKVWEWTKENQNILKKKLVKSGDTNLTVCYLDAGRPMWWSYLCDRCSTPLHLLSQPAPSLQVVDLNSSESTQ